jgi:hypothetical protein
MGVSEATAGLIAAGVAAAAAGTGTAVAIHSQNSAREAATAQSNAALAAGKALPKNIAAQDTQSVVNAQQTKNAQAGQYLNSPAVSNSPNATKKSLLGT